METEWVLTEERTNRLKLCTATDQEEAIRIALAQGLRPENTNQVRPRVERADSDNRIMRTRDFREFMEDILG